MKDRKPVRDHPRSPKIIHSLFSLLSKVYLKAVSSLCWQAIDLHICKALVIIERLVAIYITTKLYGHENTLKFSAKSVKCRVFISRDPMRLHHKMHVLVNMEISIEILSQNIVYVAQHCYNRKLWWIWQLTTSPPKAYLPIIFTLTDLLSKAAKQAIFFN